MPRRRNNNNQPMTLDEFAEIIEDDNMISMVKYVVCKDFLKDKVWELQKATNEKNTCSICIEDINCKHCFCLLSCGHSYHSSCLMKWNKGCPLCKN